MGYSLHFSLVSVVQGLTVPTASSWKGGPVSVGWGLRAESLLLLTNSGVPKENRTHEDMVQVALSVCFPLKDVSGDLKISGTVMMFTLQRFFSDSDTHPRLHYDAKLTCEHFNTAL